MDIFDYDAPEYTLIRNLLPDFEEIYYELTQYTDAELNYGLEALNQGYNVESLEDLASVVIAQIQHNIIDIILKFEFANEQDYYDFMDKYCDDIADYCVESEFISRQGPGTYHIDFQGILFLEAILANIDDDLIDNYEVTDVNWYELVNELNSKFELKFII